jgi:hypothetical protein
LLHTELVMKVKNACLSFICLSSWSILFLALSILPSCLTLRRSATQPSIQASKLVIKKTCNRKSQHHPTKFKFPYLQQRLQSVGSNNLGYWSSSIHEGNNLDRVFYCKIWFYRGAKILFGSYLAVEREKARAHNFLHDAWPQSYYPRRWQYGPNLWCNLVQRRSHRPHFFGIDRLPQRLHQAAPMVVVDVIPYRHTELIWVVQTWSFLFPGKIFRSKEQY